MITDHEYAQLRERVTGLEDQLVRMCELLDQATTDAIDERIRRTLVSYGVIDGAAEDE